jgi:hypothetical protein
MGRIIDDYNEQKLCELYLDGHETKKLKTIFKCSTNTVLNVLHKHNVEIRGGGRKGKNDYDDNNSSQYNNLAIRQTVQEYKSTGKVFVMTDSLLHKVESRLDSCMIEEMFDEHTQCKYYIVRREL